MANNATFLGVGWGFKVDRDSHGMTLDQDGKISLAEYEESVRQSIWIILGTAKGERVMRPNFGCGIHDLVFGVNTASTSGQISNSIRESLLLFEPRIDVLDILVNSDSEKLLINIQYEVRATNNVFNLVYPFYLQSGSV